MRGMLADVNVQGHLVYLRWRLEALDLWSVLVALQLEFATFADLQIPAAIDDRFLWNLCQRRTGTTTGWTRFTRR